MQPGRGLGVLVIAVLMAGCQADQGGESPAVQMVRDNDAASLADYLAQGGDPNALSEDGAPLLYLAAGPRGGMAVLSALIAAGAQVDAANRSGRTALMNAAGWCDAEMVAALLETGADPALAASDGKTARDAVCPGPLDRRAEVLNIL